MTIGKATELIEYGSLFVFNWTNGAATGAGYIFTASHFSEKRGEAATLHDVLNELGAEGWDFDEAPLGGLTNIQSLIGQIVSANNARPEGPGARYNGKRRYTK